MNILVVSPHPDDETLGAGGLLLKNNKEGGSSSWLNITSIENDDRFSIEIQEKRASEIKKINEYFGFKRSFNLKYQTTRLDEINDTEAIGRISEIILEVQPDTIILPDFNDAHRDHEIVFNWCFACTKVFRYPFIKRIMTMEILSETDFGKPLNYFNPNFFVDISEFMNGKIEAMKIYESELGEPPFPRSEENIRALGTLRGGQAGFRYAEGYKLIKYIME